MNAHRAALESRIGPNSVLQTLFALDALEPPSAKAAVSARAALPSTEAWPAGLIPEAWFHRTVDAVRATLPPPRAEAVLRRAGAETARYVATHRIPRPFRWLLAALPARAGVPLLLAAFRRHAWTFAGSARFTVAGRALHLDPYPRQCAAFYAAAFEGLVRLAAPRARVREADDHFTITLDEKGEPACASS